MEIESITNQEVDKGNQHQVNISHTISFEVPKDKRGRVDWITLKEKPEQLREYILFEAKSFYETENNISQQLLVKRKKSGLANAICKFYEGSYSQLRKDMNLDEVRKPNDYWTPERIEQEARDYYQTTGKFGSHVLKKDGQFGFEKAIRSNYPGGITALKRKLGVKEIKESGYWTPETIKREAQSFFNRYHDFTIPLLEEQGMGGLARACRKYYPGGFMQVRIDLGLYSRSKPVSFWQTPEKMRELEAQVLDFCRNYGNVSQHLLRENNKGDLIWPIYKCYPGGINAIKEKLGINTRTSDIEKIDITSEEANADLDRLFDII